MSYLQTIKNEIAETRQLIHAHTGITDAAYDMHYFETGVALAEKLCKDQEAATCLTNDPIYWGWFALQWKDVCNEFLDCIKYVEGRFCLAFQTKKGLTGYILDRGEIAMTYTRHLSKKILECEHTSNIMHLSFHQMIKRKSITV